MILRRNLIDVRVGVEQSVIDASIDHLLLHVCIRATPHEDNFNFNRDVNYPKHQLNELS